MEDGKLRIFSAIDEVMAKGGITAVTMSAVAACCGMHKGNLLYYFTSKDEMLLQYFEYTVSTRDNDFYAKLEEFLATHDRSPESLATLIEMLLDVSLKEPSMRDAASITLLSIADHDDRTAALLDTKYERFYSFCERELRAFVPPERFDERVYGECCSELFLNLLGILYLKMGNLELPYGANTIRSIRARFTKLFLQGKERED